MMFGKIVPAQYKSYLLRFQLLSAFCNSLPLLVQFLCQLLSTSACDPYNLYGDQALDCSGLFALSLVLINNKNRRLQVKNNAILGFSNHPSRIRFVFNQFYNL